MEAAPFASSSSASSLSSRAVTARSSSSSLLFRRNNIRNSYCKFKSPRNFSVRASGDSVVTLLDYGAGNVRSVRNAIRHLGFDIKDVQTPEDILKANRLIFPGVGAFAAAMDVLNKNGMAEALCTYIEKIAHFWAFVLDFSYFSSLVRRMDL
ncbi:hypothetical protein SLA2020_283970 [Shorea laevis]